ncbi:MAG TPA: SDR family oxidoreductase [Devosia sp.]|jgi:3-oxoacyl-[acyl-carrier protein] reductase|nr:SDR family oxidoreductase [Devosia sp.]
MTVAIVTGASRGLGAAMAKALAADGHRVAVNYAHDQDGAERVVAAIAGAGGEARAYRFDVTDGAAVATGFAAIGRDLGVPDIVVSNAIGQHGSQPVEQQTWDSHLAQLVFCVKAPLLLLQSVVGEWKTRRAGCMINIGSEVVSIGNPELAPYVGAKAAMVGLTRSWARELGPFDIRVNLVEPGYIPVERHSSTPQSSFDQYAEDVALRRMGRPEDVAGMVAYLASPRANFITGQTFAVNGGRTLA